MKFLPVAINIHRKKILLIGGGRVAYQKIKTLRRFTTSLTVVAEDISPAVKRTGVRCITAPYRPSHLKGYFLVYACTNQKSLNASIRKDARKQGLLVNVVDCPDLCDFISPAIFKKGHMTVAINSDGRNAKRSVVWRDKIKDFF